MLYPLDHWSVADALSTRPLNKISCMLSVPRIILKYCMNFLISTANDVFSKLMEMLIQISNKHAPMKQLFRHQMKLQRKPWIAKGLDYNTVIRPKQWIHKSFFLYDNPAFMAYFKKYANDLTKLKCAAKRLPYKKKIKERRKNESTHYLAGTGIVSTWNHSLFDAFINVCFKSGLFSEILKVSKVIPIFSIWRQN